MLKTYVMEKSQLKPLQDFLQRNKDCHITGSVTVKCSGGKGDVIVNNGPDNDEDGMKPVDFFITTVENEVRICGYPLSDVLGVHLYNQKSGSEFIYTPEIEKKTYFDDIDFNGFM
jgi:hypothetical protein